ncbi:TPA: hypothetical protein ACQGT3_004443 [Pseudomonas aeruginosa]|nr:hypothetical protein [Pseudomonas aeruginosa]
MMKAIADILKGKSYKIEDGALDIYGEEEELQEIYAGIISTGYKGEKLIENGELGLCLSIELSPDRWSIYPPFFPTQAELWQYILSNSKLPELYYVLQERVYSGQDPEHRSVGLTRYYLEWWKLLGLLKDHVGSEGSDSTLVYFISTDKGAKKYEINPKKITLEELLSFSDENLSKDGLDQLYSALVLEDRHQKERRDVLRTSLSELLEENHSESLMPWLMKQGRRLQKKYLENYDIYLHKFSVNKLLSEIEEKSTDYISKINDSISSSQTKAFAIPGAIIAIAALIKNTDTFSLIFVCFGLLSVWVLTVIANKIHREAYETLEEQVRRSLKRYEVMKDENEVRVVATASKNRLLSIIEKSKERLKFIDRLSFSVFLAGCFYTVGTNEWVQNFANEQYENRGFYIKAIEVPKRFHRWNWFFERAEAV